MQRLDGAQQVDTSAKRWGISAPKNGKGGLKVAISTQKGDETEAVSSR